MLDSQAICSRGLARLGTTLIVAMLLATCCALLAPCMAAAVDASAVKTSHTEPSALGPDLFPALSRAVENAELEAGPAKTAESDALPEASEPAPALRVEPVSAKRLRVKTSTPCGPGSCGRSVRAKDQIWLVSSRGLSCASVDCVDSGLQFYRYHAGAGWMRSSAAEFAATDSPFMPTTVWVHGNRASAGDAKQIGMTVYREVAAKASQSVDNVQLRFVIWSWPSDRIRGLLRDVRAKAARTNLDGYFLAQFLQRIDPATPVSLMGYSYGARIVTGALHLLGGGQLSGRRLRYVSSERNDSYNVVLIAAAVDADWLAVGHRLGRAMSQVRRILIVTNPSDRVLRNYFRLDRATRADALGYVGVQGNLGRNRYKVTQIAIHSRKHIWTDYIFSGNIVNMMRTYFFVLLPRASSTPPLPALRPAITPGPAQ